MVNNNIIVVQAIPKAHPGGVQGALLSWMYHSFSIGLEPINKEPKAKAPKLRIRKRKKVSDLLILLIQIKYGCF